MKSARNWAYKTLRRSESFFKTDMVYLAKGGFWLTFGQAVSVFTSFGLAVAFANLIPSQTYGTYQFVLATAGILSATTLSGLNTAAIRSVAKGAEGVIKTSLMAKLRWGTLGSLAAFGIGVYYYFQNNSILAISFLIVSIFLPLFYSLGISNSLLKGRKLFSADVKYGIVGQLISASVVLLTLFLTDNLFFILLAYFTVWTTVRYIIYKLIIGRFKTNDKTDPEITTYGKHLSAMGFIGTIADNLDKLLIFHFLGAVEVAVYSFAIAPVMQLKGLLKNIHVLALPKLSLRSKAEIQRMITKRSLITLLASSPIVILYILTAPFIYKLFFPNYIEAVIYSQIFATSILFAAVGTLAATSLEAQMEVRKKYTLTAVSKTTKILLMLVLVIPYGIGGIVAALLINYLLVVLLAIWLVRRN
jgi:O-antigen/teichoic acid export membrane protein